MRLGDFEVALAYALEEIEWLRFHTIEDGIACRLRTPDLPLARGLGLEVEHQSEAGHVWTNDEGVDPLDDFGGQLPGPAPW